MNEDAESNAIPEEHEEFTLQPMTVGQTLDRIWVILRRNALLLLALGAAPALSVLLSYGAVLAWLFAEHILPPQQNENSRKLVSEWLVAAPLGSVPFFLIYALFMAATCWAALAADRGESPTLRDAYRAAWRRAGRYCWLMILQCLCIAVPVIVCGAAVAGGFVLAASAQTGRPGPAALFFLMPLVLLVYPLIFAYAVWMGLRISLAFPASVAEDLTAMEALKRSGRLTHRAKGRMFLVLLVVYAVGYAVMMVLELVGMAVVAVAALAAEGMHLGLAQPLTLVGMGVLGLGMAAVLLLCMAGTWASYAVTFSVIYGDQRLRWELARKTAVETNP